MRNSHVVAHPAHCLHARKDLSALILISATLLNFFAQHCGAAAGHNTALERTCLKVPTRCRLYCAVGKIADAK